MDKDYVVGREPYLGELVLIFCYVLALCADLFTPLWCDLVLEEASVGVLGSHIY